MHAKKNKEQTLTGTGFLKLKEAIENNQTNTEDENTPSLIDLLDRLYTLTQKREDSFTDTLSKVLSRYLDGEEWSEHYNNELAQFRNTWCLLHYFDYTDDDYSKDKPISKEQLEQLRDHIEYVLTKASKAVQKIYLRSEDNNFIPLNDYCYSQKTIDKINAVCQNSFSKDTVYNELTYNKLIEIYNRIRVILRDTAFEQTQVVINADW